MSAPKILIIDDEQAVIDAIEMSLKKEGYELLFALDGKSGLEAYQTHQPDLILLDLKTPGVDGFQVLNHLGRSSTDPCSTILLTGHGEDPDFERLNASGVSAFLKKPLNLCQLKGFVRHTLMLKQPLADMRRNEEKLRLHQTELEAQNEELRQAQSKLQAISQSYSDLYELAPLGYISIGSKGLITSANLTATKMLGIERNRLLNLGILHFVDPEFEGTLWKHREATRKSGLKETFEVKMLPKEGTPFWAHVEMVAGGNQEGEGPQWRIGMVDITERKQAEQEKAFLEEQLQQAQKLEAIGTLAGGIAHDFNNILSGIHLSADIIKLKESKGMSLSGEVEGIARECKRAKSLISQLLYFGTKREKERRRTSVEPILKEVLKAVRAFMPTTIEIKEHLGQDDCTVLIDPTEFYQVLMNLCVNASQAMKGQHGKLELTLKKETLDEDSVQEYPGLCAGTYVRISVSDTGPGIPAEHLERIFEPFFTTKQRGEGRGLGLSVVHGIVTRCGGTVRAWSELGYGTTFHVLLPRTGEAAEAEAPLDQSFAESQERILLVDDSPAILTATSTALELLGYRVDACNASQEALEVFRKDPDRFDLVLTDLTMPEMTGVELAREIVNIRKDIPILISSGYDCGLGEGHAKELGIRKILPKPVGLSELSAAIREITKT